MRTQITFAASIATLALLSACTKERLEPMTAMPEARTSATVIKPLVMSDKHAQLDRVITAATVVDRNRGQVTGSDVHDITAVTPAERITPNAIGSHAQVITRFDGDRADGNASSSANVQTAQTAGVCSYCWQTGLAAYPAQMPIRLLESDDPVGPSPRLHISGEFLPGHANTPTTVIGPIGREVPDNETVAGPAVSGEEVGITISDDGGKDE